MCLPCFFFCSLRLFLFVLVCWLCVDRIAYLFIPKLSKRLWFSCPFLLFGSSVALGFLINLSTLLLIIVGFKNQTIILTIIKLSINAFNWIRLEPEKREMFFRWNDYPSIMIYSIYEDQDSYGSNEQFYMKNMLIALALIMRQFWQWLFCKLTIRAIIIILQLHIRLNGIAALIKMWSVLRQPLLPQST